EVGEAVGIIDAQSIGEAGTLPTMRTFRTGGSAGDDITQWWPSCRALLDGRSSRAQAVISEFGGTIQDRREDRDKREIVVEKDAESVSYTVPYNGRLTVSIGDEVKAGQELNEGSIDPKELLQVQGVDGVQSYLLREVQRVYRMQGVEISDKH